MVSLTILSESYRLNVCVLPKCVCWSLNPPVWGYSEVGPLGKMRSQGQSPHDRVSARADETTTRLSTTEARTEGSPLYTRKRDFTKNPVLLAPWSGISSLHNWEEEIFTVWFTPSTDSVTAAQTIMTQPSVFPISHCSLPFLFSY